MGRKGNWFTAVKKALSQDTQENNQEHRKSKKKWFRKKKKSNPEPAPTEATISVPPTQILQPQNEPEKASEVDKEQTKHACSIAIATAKAAEAAAEAAAEVIRLTASAKHFAGKSKEEVASIKIQTAFRGYLAKRQLRALRGFLRLKTLMQGHSVKHQTANTLKALQTLARVQSQIRERRLRMAEENRTRQRLLQNKHAKELEKSQVTGDGWDCSLRTKEQIEAKLQSKHEAAIRRERTLAYAFNHQQTWKPSSRSTSTLFMDPNSPHWGWSWLERWLAARPWETATIPDNEFQSESSSIAPKNTKNDVVKPSKSSPKAKPNKQGLSSTTPLSSPSTPSKAVARKSNPKKNPKASLWGPEDEARSVVSMTSDTGQRNRVEGSSIRDDESLASSQTVPSYMAPTESVKAKSRLGNESKANKNGKTPDRSSVSSVEKRQSYTPSPVKSRRSTSSITDANSVL